MAKSTIRRNIIIAGAGIAGLTGALALAQKGFRVLVLEKRREPAEEGAGIQVSPNAYKILSALGLGRAVQLASNAPAAIDIRSGGSGELVTSFRLGASFRKRHNAPYLVLHRADLLNILLNACKDVGAIQIRNGVEVTDAATHANGVTLLLKDGTAIEEIHGVAVIGADGIWSNLRRSMETLSPPRFSGHIAWRGLIPMKEVSEAFSKPITGLWLGQGSHLVHYPVQRGTMLNVVAITPWQGANEPPRGWIADCPDEQRLSPFAEWHQDVIDLLNVETKWGGWSIHAVDRATCPYHQHICLIGDAAHAMLPYAAQGGAAGIEDAAVLAEACAENAKDMEQAFQAFWQKREKRLNKLVSLAQTNRKIYHLPSRSAAVRDFTLGLVPQPLLQWRMDWNYGWEI